MYTKLLSVIAILEIMWGTIFSVLCVLKMTLKDIMWTSTCGGLGDGWKNSLTQRHYARCGILYIVFGSLLQIYMVITENITLISFVVSFALAVIAPSIFTIWSTIVYSKQLKKGWQKLDK